MNIWTNSIEWIRKLFGAAPLLSGADGKRFGEYAAAYEDTGAVNFTAMISNKLAAFVVSESSAGMVFPSEELSQRDAFLNGCLERLWRRMRSITARALGTGGVVLVPYVSGGTVSFDAVPQSRFFITQTRGDRITAATILADSAVIENKRFYRWADYYLGEDGVHVIRNRATTDSDVVSLQTVPGWAEIPEEFRIGNVDRLLLGFFRSPTDSRGVRDLYGVPITYGCDCLLNEIAETLEQVRQEYALKRPFVGLDERLLTKGRTLPNSGLFTFLTGSNNGDLWELFDPAIRDSAYYNRLDQLFGLLEKQVGVSRGILTKPESRGATATEIKASLYDTYSLVEAVRDAAERAVEDFVYACEVLGNAYGLIPAGSARDGVVNIEWSYALIESSAETFSQLIQGEASGAIETAEVRQYLMTDETLPEARARVAEIRAGKRVLAAELLNRTLIEDSQGLNDE